MPPSESSYVLHRSERLAATASAKRVELAREEDELEAKKKMKTSLKQSKRRLARKQATAKTQVQTASNSSRKSARVGLDEEQGNGADSGAIDGPQSPGTRLQKPSVLVAVSLAGERRRHLGACPRPAA